MQTHLPRATKRPLVYTPNQLASEEPHIIVPAVFVTPEYLGGGSIEIDWMLSKKAYARIQRKAP